MFQHVVAQEIRLLHQAGVVDLQTQIIDEPVSAFLQLIIRPIEQRKGNHENLLPVRNRFFELNFFPSAGGWIFYQREQLECVGRFVGYDKQR